MTREQFAALDEYMRSCMREGAHGKEHVYRVLYIALDIARREEPVDYDVLITACLLHDIARGEQMDDPGVCHALLGAEKAAGFLRERGCGEPFIEKVAHCIRAHRFRSGCPPESKEARILFDADKVDVTGAVGLARTLQYGGEKGEPLYTPGPDGLPSGGEGDREGSFFREYKFKLEKLYDRFYTDRGRELALERQETAAAFYKGLLAECRGAYESRPLLDEILES